MKDFKTKSRSIHDLDTPKSDFMALYNKERADRKWNKLSQHIAVKLHSYLKKNQLKQKDLAALMEVSPQQISKILSGKVNLTLETISKIEAITNIDIISKEPVKAFEDNLYEIFMSLDKLEQGFEKTHFIELYKDKKTLFNEIQKIFTKTNETKTALSKHYLFKFSSEEKID